MIKKVSGEIRFFTESITNSYSQVLFSDNRWLAVLVMLATFLDPFTGLSGLLTLFMTLVFARWMGFNPAYIRNGSYGFNGLLVGLAMGFFFTLSPASFAVQVLAALLTLFITVWLAGVSTGFKVPFLSLPFMLSIWIILLSVRSFTAIHLSERGIYTFNELWNLGGSSLVHFYDKTNSFTLPLLIMVYLKSLGAIFFQYNIISGLLIATGLLIYSRIAFSLSCIGFLTGYLFCYFVEGNLSELEYSYIGFNFILSAIAIGGFFIVPSGRSYLMAIVSAPLVGLLISAMGKIVGVYGLPLYSLPFSLVVILLIFVFNNRYYVKNLQLVLYQQYSPEKNLYTHHNRIERFKSDTYFHIYLPFFGEWNVSQAHDGKITHKGDWQFAWDFVVTDESQRTFKLPGKELNDFYCYGLPVLAPAAGYVVSLVDGIDDNPVGEVNIGENWGNSIVIKHGEYFYSEISHIKKESFKVKQGDYVRRGEVLALCGNSGRSPEPHIHFQMQATPKVGAKTLQYPVSYFVEKRNGKYLFNSFDYPKEGQTLLNTKPTTLLQNAFNFTPGKIIQFEVADGKNKYELKWEVFVDVSNLPYIYCHKTGSFAYFTNNETLHYFTDFKGDRQSLLYYFYLGAHKILLSYFHEMEVKDILPIDGFFTGAAKVIQDFVSPFHIYLNAGYSSVFSGIDDEAFPKKIKILSSATASVGTKINRKLDFEMNINEKGIQKFTVKEKGACICAENID